MSAVISYYSTELTAAKILDKMNCILRERIKKIKSDKNFSLDTGDNETFSFLVHENLVKLFYIQGAK